MSLSPHQDALVSVMQAAGRIRRQLASVLCGEGIGASQYNILRILRGARGPVAIMTIRERMLDPEPSITRLIDRLVERGLVDRARCTHDRRCVDCTITERGLGVLTRLDESVDRRDREIMARLKKSDLKTLSALLERVGDAE